jgi:hypothetical protein
MIHDASVAKSVAREIDLVMSFRNENIVQVRVGAGTRGELGMSTIFELGMHA